MEQQQTQQSGEINVDELVGQIEVPPNLKDIFDKAVLSGLRIMFDRQSHKMFLDQLEKPGSMADKMAEGLVGLVYMLWQESNKTLPPQIILPVTVVLTLRAFEFLQKAGEPEATKEMLGEAMEKATTKMMQQFGVPEEQIGQMASQAPAVGGLIQQAQGV